MKQRYRALWNVSTDVHRKHYFTCTDHELHPRRALEMELEQIGEPVPEEPYLEKLGLPFDEASQEKAY